MHVSLTPKLTRFVKAKVQTGLYNNASEVIRESLRLMREHDEVRRLKLDRLREELLKGENALEAGRSVVLKSDRELAEFFARL